MGRRGNDEKEGKTVEKKGISGPVCWPQNGQLCLKSRGRMRKLRRGGSKTHCKAFLLLP